MFALIGTTRFVKTLIKKKSHPTENVVQVERVTPKEPVAPKIEEQLPIVSTLVEAPVGDFPQVDRIHQLFAVKGEKLPIVETLSYTTRVSWLKGKPAWISDYANQFQTSKHFIARSLNGTPDYQLHDVSSGKKFNVLSPDKKIQFHLLVDRTLCKMGFYYIDLGTQERVLLKTYRVGLGRLDPTSASGCLTPLGKFSLGDKVAIYKPGVTGFFHDKKVEMVSVFGSRWIPFVDGKGLGLHGAPWRLDARTGEWVELVQTIGQYESDGCIRLAEEDVQEIFSIVISRPTCVEIVTHFQEAKLPGVERL